MKSVQGVIDCKETKEIPKGSVIFVYVCKDSKVIGHQTFMNVTQFPFEYKVDFSDEEAKSDEMLAYNIKVNIENGETTLFLNGSGNLTSNIDPTKEQINVDVNLQLVSS